ncbi:MAG: hypothetical protein KKF54_01830, partial [Candidatus Omnitrophica bacterium]|nr:hypothetical protein [Candidatus Omnitrophota bacterium]
MPPTFYVKNTVSYAIFYTLLVASSQVKISLFFGNDKIDSYPPGEDLRIRKILLIKRKLFEELKKDIEVFKTWLISLKKKETKSKPKVSLSSLPVLSEAEGTGQSRKQDKLKNDNQLKYQSIYLPTDIGYTRYGNLWRWRRVNKWVKEFIQ